MIKPGLLIWTFRDKDTFYIRFLHLFGFGVELIDGKVGIGSRITIGIYKLELGFHIIKRRGTYVERIKNEKSPTASA
jgi:hypothetical protein